MDEKRGQQGRNFVPRNKPDPNREKQRKQCSQFFNFLKLDGVTNEASTKEKLRDVYSRHYKPSVEDHLPSFSEMIYQMKGFGFIKVRDNELVEFKNLETSTANSRQKPPLSDNERRQNKPSTSTTSGPMTNGPLPGPQKSQANRKNQRQGNRENRRPSQNERPRKPSGTTMLSVDQHVALRVRARKLADSMTEPSNAMSPGQRLENPFRCALCQANCNTENQLTNHKTGSRHRLNCSKFKLELKQSDLVDDKEGVTITSHVTRSSYDDRSQVTRCSQEDGRVEIRLEHNDTKRFNFELHNSGKGLLELQLCLPLNHRPACTLDDPQGVTMGRKVVLIAEGESYEILATCNSSVTGYQNDPVLFQFSRAGKLFQILRYVLVITESSFTECVRSIGPYKPPPRSAVKPVYSNIEPGLPLDKSENKDELERKVELKFYTISTNMRTVVNHGIKPFNGITPDQKILLQNFTRDFEVGLTEDNYGRLFRNLLYLEEIQMEVDIRRYDMGDSQMTVVRENDRLLELEIPGLAENRPSIIKGDKIYLKGTSTRNDENQFEFEGIVHQVREKTVWVGFGQKFRSGFLANMRFGIRFTVNRLPTRVQHRAIDLTSESELWALLFPTWDSLPIQSEQLLKSNFRFRNPQIEGNVEQQQAICNIVSGTSGSAPYIIYGPPGTGKTVTLVESIKQVLIVHENAHVLACAPSNSAADLIAQRLILNDPAMRGKVFRMHALSRHFDTVPDSIQAISNYLGRNGQYYYPKMEKLCEYKVIVTTLMTAGRIVSASFKPNHFTHVFIDECGHAIEPEAVIPIAGVLESLPGRGGQLVLVGDPKQLGPILRSPIARNNGLETSLLERLMRMGIYQRQNQRGDPSNGLRNPHGVSNGNDVGGSYNPYVITKLVRNYRSHPSLLTVPNELFYENELQPFANELIRNQLCEWEDLPTKGIPIIFHGVVGKDEQESRSPSFFNCAEIDVVLGYVQKLLCARGITIVPDDIGIISPYNQQVRKIRAALNALGRKRDKMKEMGEKDLSKITVGSTEEFQGQERKVVIISTVRSNPDLLKLDSTYKLGFLRNPKRFNVAVTRAKCLMIMVGNPHLLRLDQNWDSYLEYCLLNRTYTGCRYNPTDDIDELIKNIEKINLGDDAAAALDAYLGNLDLGEEEPRWRHDM